MLSYNVNQIITAQWSLVPVVRAMVGESTATTVQLSQGRLQQSWFTGGSYQLIIQHLNGSLAWV